MSDIIAIQSKIYTIRDVQVMIDSDLAELYEVETKQLNKAVNRNLERFPQNFRFQLTQEEFDNLRFQNGTSSEHGGRRYLPYAFTEQGVSMLSAVLRSATAVQISIKIIESFVNMRKFISSNIGMFERFERIEQRLSIHDENFNRIFQAIESQSLKSSQGIFYDGQIFDAYAFVADLIKQAQKTITLFDNYIDETVLTLLSKNQNVDIAIYTKNISKQLELDVGKYNLQYKPIEIKKFDLSHDRFLLIDEDIYHIGASLKDLGKKWFAFSKMDRASFEIMARVE
ncbi:MAG: ORF6N domain-containing protein [Sulfuricurvum sp.]|nr:ORF6N domain-containing protein [Sulfuricurvum sp.]